MLLQNNLSRESFQFDFNELSVRYFFLDFWLVFVVAHLILHLLQIPEKINASCFINQLTNFCSFFQFYLILLILNFLFFAFLNEF